MTNQRVTIPNPCHLKWQGFEHISNSDNKYCQSCATEIVDFTRMSNEEVIAFLTARKHTKTCGKVYEVDKKSALSGIQSHILTWHDRVHQNVNNRLLKSFSLSVLAILIFITGCTTHLGEPAMPPCTTEFVPDTTTVNPSDSIYVEICEDQ